MNLRTKQDVAFWGLSLLIVTIVGSALTSRADCTGCWDGSAAFCRDRWVLPDGTSICLDSHDRFQQLLDTFPDCKQPSKLEPAFEE